MTLLCHLSAHADYRVPLQPPAGAQSKAMRVEVGQRVEILLEARGNGGREVMFILRDAPKRGKLGPIQKLQAGKAKVVYTHNSRKGVGVDAFRYAVQMSGGPVSAAGTITIEAVDRGPRLEFPLMLDFGQVTLGDQPEQVIELANTGGGLISGGVATDGPFQLLGNAIFQLGPRKKTQMRVRFNPTAPGEYTGSAIVSAVGGGHIELIGSCIVPFTVTPDTADLLSDSSGCRAARFTIRSSTEGELACSLTYEGPVAGPPQVRLAPLDVGAFDVWAKESEAGESTGRVIVRAGTFEKTLPLTIAPLGARLKVGPLAKIDAGEIPQGKEAKAEIWIENAGGESATVRVSARGLILEPASEEIALAPGARQILQARWTEPKGGPSLRRIELHSSGPPLAVDLEARFHGATETPAIPNLPIEPVASIMAEAKPIASDADVARITRIEVTKRTETTLEMKWKEPDGAMGYVTELYVFEKVDGEIKPLWRQVQPDSLEVKEGTAYLKLEDLNPGSAYSFRFRVKDGLDRLSLPSPEVHLTTLTPKSWHFPWTALGLGLLVLIGGWLLYLRLFRN